MHRIEIDELGYGARGPIYRVTYDDEVLIDGARVPALDAARALLAMGITGRLEMWHQGAWLLRWPR